MSIKYSIYLSFILIVSIVSSLSNHLSISAVLFYSILKIKTFNTSILINFNIIESFFFSPSSAATPFSINLL